jgi:hypothetical protein
MPRVLVCALVSFGLVVPLRAAQPQFWKLEGSAQFLEGDLDGISVDSEGRVRLAPALRQLDDPETPNVWSIVADAKGTVYMGTGNDGKVFKLEGGRSTVVFDAPELQAQALALGPDGRLYVGTGPEGRVYAVDAGGTATTFFDPSDRYIWALAFDASGRLYVATGAEGKIYRVDSKGKGEAVLATTETHLLSLALDAKGNLYAGSAPGGIVYRLDPSSKVFVLHDSPYREIKALEVGADGSVYAAAIDGQARPAAAPAPSPAAGAQPMAEVTVTESFALPVPATPPAAPAVAPPEPELGPVKGALLRIAATGEIETLWTSADEMPHALARSDAGILVGTGNRGKVYRVRDDRTWSMVSALPAEQVTALFPRAAGGGTLVATSNPGKLHLIEARPGTQGTFVSKPMDTDTVSSWGRLSWEATLPPGTDVQLHTRSGNTATPDTTWTDWSAAYRRPEGEAIVSERARFLQLRASLAGREGRTPVLEAITAAYLQRNLRPRVTSISVHSPGEVFQKPISISGETEILGLDPAPASERLAAARGAAPPATSYSRRLYQRGIQTFSWKAEDPNGDTLLYDVHYRAVGDARFRPLRTGLSEPVLAWDTSTVPNGRYQIQVVASDLPSNPASLALTGARDSVPFDVDNTPPSVSATLVQRSPTRIRVVARDDSSIIRRAEYAIDGGRWEEIHPVDGINDALEETYEITLDALSGPAPHVVIVRVTDLLGNAATARVDVP